MKNKYKIQNKDQTTGVKNGIGDIKKIQKEVGNRASTAELIGEWIISIFIVLMLVWIAFKAHTLT